MRPFVNSESNERTVDIGAAQGIMTKEQIGTIRMIINYERRMKRRSDITRVSVTDKMYDSLVLRVRQSYKLPSSLKVRLTCLSLEVAPQSRRIL